MSRGQLQKLYFSSLGRCNTRLRQLFDHGFVSRYYLPAAPFGAQAIYSIGKAAIPVVAKQVEMDIRTVTKHYRRTQTPTFIEHTLEIVNVRIAFEEAVKQSPEVEIERWLPEMFCRHEYDIRESGSGTWMKEVFKPDAFVRLKQRDSGTYFNYFIEVDLGHTSSRQFLGKLLMHQQYMESGLFNDIFGCEQFRTLVITTTDGRLCNLQRLTQDNFSALCWFATFSCINQFGILGSIWKKPFCSETKYLF
ncbi:MAG: replication-relaxation family protein [Abitibacteriaceae bacterium]|nr:replication-relaxation family protein [Abditibacteriaceae bacterium]